MHLFYNKLGVCILAEDKDSAESRGIGTILEVSNVVPGVSFTGVVPVSLTLNNSFYSRWALP